MDQRRLAAHLQKEWVARLMIPACLTVTRRSRKTCPQQVRVDALWQLGGKSWTGGWSAHVPQIAMAMAINLEHRPHAAPGAQPVGDAPGHSSLARRAKNLREYAAKHLSSVEDFWNSLADGRSSAVAAKIFTQKSKEAAANLRQEYLTLVEYWNKVGGNGAPDCDCAICRPCKRDLGLAAADVAHSRQVSFVNNRPRLTLTPPCPSSPCTPSLPIPSSPQSSAKASTASGTMDTITRRRTTHLPTPRRPRRSKSVKASGTTTMAMPRSQTIPCRTSSTGS